MATDELSVRRTIKSNSFVNRTLRSFLARLTGQHFGGRRDLYDVCGYPANIEPKHYLAQYTRGDLAARIVDAYPDATWRETPTVKPTGAQDGDDNPLQLEIEKLDAQFGFWSTLARLDRLTGLGHYGVLLLGLDGGRPLQETVTGGNFRLIYLAPSGEVQAEVMAWEVDARSPRYGKPLRYRITTGPDWTGVGGAQQSLTVHWSRVIHVAEKSLDDESIGLPRLERIFNRVMDCEKLLGGSAEIYWQNAANTRAWEADPEVEWDPQEQKDMEAQFEELYHGLRRDLRLRGVTPHNLAASVTDPKGHVDVQLDFIAGATGIPKRILIGSERGELSSEQDENNWAARVAERRTDHATPKIIRPTIDRLIRYGVLPDVGEYEVEWPESDALGEEKRAQIAKTKAEAVSFYVSIPGADYVVPPQEFRRWLGEEEVSEFEIEEPALELDETDPAAAAQFAANKRRVANATPKPLYVRRNVLNAEQLIEWAKAQGFPTTLPPEEMHVTIAYSRTPIDWMRIGEAYEEAVRIPPGGPRVVEPLGPKGAVVLFISSSALTWRHEEIRRAGASWDWPDYSPHISITYNGAGALDLGSIEPYRGEIVLGPEIFEELEVEESWSDQIEEQ